MLRYFLFMMIITFSVFTFNANMNLKNELFTAKTIAVGLDKKNKELTEKVRSLNEYIDDMENLDRLLQDLHTIPRNMRSVTLANCYNESNLNYDVRHTSKYDKTTVGICGIKADIWIPVIDELNEDNINSLLGGYLVLSHLIQKTGSIEKALKWYKGVRTNYAPVEHTIRLDKLIKGDKNGISETYNFTQLSSL